MPLYRPSKSSGKKGANLIGLCVNPPLPGFVAACSRLTELTLLFPNGPESWVIRSQDGVASAAVLDVVTTCKALPNLDTIQIVYFPCEVPDIFRGSDGRWYDVGADPVWGFIREKLRHWTDTGVIRSRQSECGEGEGEGEGESGKKTTLRLVELGSDHPDTIVLDSVEVREYEVR